MFTIHPAIYTDLLAKGDGVSTITLLAIVNSQLVTFFVRWLIWPRILLSNMWFVIQGSCLNSFLTCSNAIGDCFRHEITPKIFVHSNVRQSVSLSQEVTWSS